MTFKAWAGFIRGKPFKSTVQDNYGPMRNVVQTFDTRKDARLRFKDVRRVSVTIREIVRKG